MKFLTKCKDGGPESTVTAYVLLEIKCLFSIMLLRFDPGSRDAYHSHAFNCISWVLGPGVLHEYLHWLNAESGLPMWRCYWSSLRPVFTYRSTFHKVVSTGTTWVLTFRGPWARTWAEYIPTTNEQATLTNGRQKVTAP